MERYGDGCVMKQMKICSDAAKYHLRAQDDQKDQSSKMVSMPNSDDSVDGTFARNSQVQKKPSKLSWGRYVLQGIRAR